MINTLGECSKWTHTGMRHQSQRLRAASWLPARPLRLTLQSSDSCDRAVIQQLLPASTGPGANVSFSNCARLFAE